LGYCLGTPGAVGFFEILTDINNLLTF
jgi:hypothetical protein